MGTEKRWDVDGAFAGDKKEMKNRALLKHGQASSAGDDGAEEGLKILSIIYLFIATHFLSSRFLLKRCFNK